MASPTGTGLSTGGGRLAAAAPAGLVEPVTKPWGWIRAQYPYLLPPAYTIADSAAPPATLRLVVVALGVGGVILLPSLYYLFRVFKAETARAPDR